jgi:hypothetical protein
VPTYVITSPDGRKFKVSGPGTREEALKQVQASYRPPQPEEAPPAEPEEATRSAGDIVKNVYGAQTEPLLAMGSSAVAAPVAGLAGVAQGIKNRFSPGMSAADRVEQVQGAMTYEPRTEGGKAVTGIISYPFEKLAQGADFAGQKASDLTGSPAIGAAVNTAIQGAPAVLLRGRGKSGGVADNVSRAPSVGPSVAGGKAPSPAAAAPAAGRPSGLAQVSRAAPSKEALRKAATDAYKRAEDAGVVIAPESFKTLQVTVSKMLEKEGIDPTLHPATTAALKRINETSGSISLSKLETLRRILKDAESTQTPADKRLAAKAVDTLDGYADTLGKKDVTAGDPGAAAAFREARNYYSRARKADELDDLVARAELSAPNFSASGMENAIRTEFRNLAKNQRRMRMFTAEEQAAIRRVAQGGKIENALRMLGKFAPTGVVSTVLSSAGGAYIAGPAGFALPLAGAAARYGATRMTTRNAARANEIVRRGPPQKPKAARAPTRQPVPSP